MKIRYILKDFLSFSKGEQRGILVLLLMLAVVSTADHLIKGPKALPEADRQAIEREVMAFENTVRHAEEEDSLRNAKGMAQKQKSTFGGSTRYTPKFKPLAISINLNKADTLELQRLSGVGPSFARRIVSYRGRLGGFTDLRQLLEVWGVDSSLYLRISGSLFIDTDSLHKIDLNTASFKEMLRHPYFSYELTRSLVLYRKKHKIFREMGEIRGLDGMNDSLFNKMLPYLTLSK
jgi:competence ComEA-like helix-hairpin-helix protein